MAQSFAEYRSLYTPEGFAATAITSEQVVARIKEGPVWVAVRNELVIGTVSVVLKGHGLYVRGMAVQPTARGAHVGVLLLAEVETFARLNDMGRLTLSTTPFLNRAISLYESHGFRRIDEGPADLSGTPLFTMEKRVSD